MAYKFKGDRIQVKLKNKKNKKNDIERLELKKYDPVIRKHTLYKEKK